MRQPIPAAVGDQVANGHRAPGCISFRGSIRENIAYGKPEATDEEVVEAARQANAWQFISEFPGGMATIVGERGVQLSGGQRQRIAVKGWGTTLPCLC